MHIEKPKHFIFWNGWSRLIAMDFCLKLIHSQLDTLHDKNNTSTNRNVNLKEIWSELCALFVSKMLYSAQL